MFIVYKLEITEIEIIVLPDSTNFISLDFRTSAKDLDFSCSFDEVELIHIPKCNKRLVLLAISDLITTEIHSFGYLDDLLSGNSY